MDIKGHVCIDYIDPNTKKIKEQITGQNHVFVDSFQSTNWMDILNITTNPNFFMTDDNTSPTDEFPYLRGSIIGWGQRNQWALGTTRGSWIAEESYLAKDIDNGYGTSWKFTYEFTSSQIDKEIKCIGITSQYNSTPLDQVILPSILQRRFDGSDLPNRGWIYKDNLGYSITNDGIITVLEPFSKTIKTINISQITGTVDNLRIGFNYKTNKAYVWRWSNNVINRLLYEFADSTFSTLLYTHIISNIAHQPVVRQFFIHDNFIYYLSINWWRADFINNINSVEILVPPCLFIPNRLGDSGTNVDSYTFTTLQNGDIAYVHYTWTQALRISMWDLVNNKFVGVRHITGSSGPGHIIKDSLLPNNSIIISDNILQYYFMHQALCAYPIPDSAPVRPPGTMIKISYIINIMYE